MKKEIFYIVIPLLLAFSGLVYKTLFLSDTIEETNKLTQSNSELESIYNRDSLVQDKITKTKEFYLKNKREDKTYDEVVADILKLTENLLQQSEIKYDGNSINQEMKGNTDYKKGTISFYINVRFTTDYNKMKKFINLLEKSDYFVNINELDIVRGRAEAPKNSGPTALNKNFDEFNVKVKTNVNLRLKFVKFL